MSHTHLTEGSGAKERVGKALKQIAQGIEDRLVDFFDEVEHTPPGPLFDTHAGTVLLAQVRDLTLRAGKRIRAALIISGATLFDPQVKEQPALVDVAAAIELLQTYLLIHDDIMDGDTVRRGAPTVHVALAGYTGDKRLGEGLGILAGDLAHALAQVLLTKMNIDEPRLKRVLGIFAAMHLDVVHGQTLDMLGNASAFEVAAHKTASYTTIGPLTVGAAMAGAREKDLLHLARIALPLGVAFQFQDDLISTFGKTELTGKPSNTDLLEGKRTVLIEEARARADRFQMKKIERVIGQKTATEQEVDMAREVLIQCGAKSACEQHIKELTDEFIAGLDRPYYDPASKAFLTDVARYLRERST